MDDTTNRNSTAAEMAYHRVRVSVGQALGLAPDAPLTPDQLAEAVDRICRAAAVIPSLALLSRDLDQRSR